MCADIKIHLHSEVKHFLQNEEKNVLQMDINSSLIDVCQHHSWVPFEEDAGVIGKIYWFE